MKKIKIFKTLLIITLFFVIGSNVVKGEETTDNIRSIYFKSSEVEQGGRLYVKLNAMYRDSTTKITGHFGNGKNSYLSVNLVDVLTTRPYFVLPHQMIPGDKYTMTMLTVEDSRGRVTYTVSSASNGTNPNLDPQGKNVVTITEKGKLKSLYLIGESEVEVDGKLTIGLETTAVTDHISVTVRNKNIWPKIAIIYLTKIDTNKYELNLANGSDKLIDGDYYISDVFMSDNSTSENLHYSSYSEGSDVLPLNYDVEFKVKKSPESEQTADPETTQETQEIELLKSISVKNSEVKLNEKVNVTIDTAKKISTAEFVFSNDNENITVNLNELNTSNTYFIVPITASEGTYKLDYVTLKDIDGKEYQYRSGEDYNKIKHFDFNVSLTIKSEEDSSNLLNLDSAKITPEMIEKVKELGKNAVIEINANDNPTISKELFEAIKNTNKTIIIKYKNLEWAFNGLDIETAKQIDVSTNIYKTNREADIAGKVSNGLIIDFSNNGELPGKSLIKIYNSEIISDIMNKNNINVYYYNEETQKFEIIKLNVEYNIKGYYEFYIDHNSKYVITTDKIANEHISNANKVETDKINIKLITIILASIVLLAIITATIIIVRKKSKGNQN